MTTTDNKLEDIRLHGLPRLERDAILTSLRKHGFSIRQIERLTGVSRGIIAKCMAKGV